MRAPAEAERSVRRIEVDEVRLRSKKEAVVSGGVIAGTAAFLYRE